MSRNTLPMIAIALSTFMAAQADAGLDVELLDDVLRIDSAEIGLETFIVTQDVAGDRLTVTHSSGDELRFVRSRVARILFRGDDDRDEFYNDSDVPLTAFAGGGNDFLVGGGADDVLAGQEGEDYLYGGAGDDTLIAGDDVLEGEVSGGSGDDAGQITRFRGMHNIPKAKEQFYRDGFDLGGDPNDEIYFDDIQMRDLSSAERLAILKAYIKAKRLLTP